MPKHIMPETVKSLRLGKYKIANNTQVRIYLLGDTLLDSGPPNEWRNLRKFIEEHSPQTLLLTHHHEDHAGNAARIAACTQCTTYIAGGPENPITKGFSIHLYQRFVWGTPEKFLAEDFPGEIHTSNGHRLIPVGAPGHSPDHTAFFEPDHKWLFAGDLYVGSKPFLLRADENLSQEIVTLKNLLLLDFEGLFCGHMGFFPDGRSRIEAKLAYFEDLIPKVRELADSGLSPSAIAKKLLKKERLTPFLTQGHFSQKNLIKACLAEDENMKKEADASPWSF